MATWLWASLEDLQGMRESKEEELTVTEAPKRGSWSGPHFMLLYFGIPHFLFWHNSCNFALYMFSLSPIVLSLQDEEEEGEEDEMKVDRRVRKNIYLLAHIHREGQSFSKDRK